MCTPPPSQTCVWCRWLGLRCWPCHLLRRPQCPGGISAAARHCRHGWWPGQGWRSDPRLISSHVPGRIHCPDEPQRPTLPECPLHCRVHDGRPWRDDGRCRWWWASHEVGARMKAACGSCHLLSTARLASHLRICSASSLVEASCECCVGTTPPCLVPCPHPLICRVPSQGSDLGAAGLTLGHSGGSHSRQPSYSGPTGAYASQGSHRWGAGGLEMPGGSGALPGAEGSGVLQPPSHTRNRSDGMPAMMPGYGDGSAGPSPGFSPGRSGQLGRVDSQQGFSSLQQQTSLMSNATSMVGGGWVIHGAAHRFCLQVGNCPNCDQFPLRCIIPLLHCSAQDASGSFDTHARSLGLPQVASHPPLQDSLFLIVYLQGLPPLPPSSQRSGPLSSGAPLMTPQQQGGGSDALSNGTGGAPPAPKSQGGLWVGQLGC
jgi:hypothetical protein